MQPHPHNPARDADWAAPAAAGKRATAKKSTAKKKTAKKSTTAKKPAKKKAARAVPQGKVRSRPADTSLRREIAGLEHKLSELERKLGELAATVDLAARSVEQPDEEIVVDPFSRFLDEAAVDRLRGQHVAIHETRGVVAHAPELAAVIAELRAQGIPLEQVALDFIAEAPF